MRPVKLTATRASQWLRLSHRWQRRWRYFCLRFVRLPETSKAIARGVAVGAFAGMFPIFGFQIICGISLAAILRGSKLAAAAATWISNPFTYVPLLALNFHVGQWLLGTTQLSFSQLEVLSWTQLWDLGSAFMATLFLGCFVMGSIVAIASYIGGLWLVHHLRHRHWRAHAPKSLADGNHNRQRNHHQNRC